jgi:hypothetical protein
MNNYYKAYHTTGRANHAAVGAWVLDAKDSPKLVVMGQVWPRPTETLPEQRAPLGGGTPTLPILVAAAKASIADPSPEEMAILARLDAALARTEEGRLRVAMLGQFKRGKSTLLNALLGAPLSCQPGCRG